MKSIIANIDDNIATIQMNNPDRRNLLNPDILNEISFSLDDFSKKSVRCAIISGSGDVFSAGYDISRLREDFSVNIPHGKTVLQQTLDRIGSLPYPVIAMINGYCIGAGFELASSCDFRISSFKSKFGITPAKIGLVYPSSGIKRIIRIVGETFARELFFTGNLFSAEKMHERGFLNYTVESDNLMDFSLKFAMDLINNSPVSISGMKRKFNSLANLHEFTDSLSMLTEDSLKSIDIEEGVRAFFEKRKPDFNRN